MKQVKTSMDRKNSVNQFYILSKGTFALVLQEEEERSIQADIEANPTLKQMIEESREEYRTGKGMTTSDLLKSMSVVDFR